ncbi:MAG: acetyltransferase [Betaproteobacteria bacterium]|nr:acetyltransferase [Betaproteobacteria bacterium]
MLELSKSLVLFAAGSSVIVEVEESCRRLGLEVAAVVRNVPGASFALAADRVIEPAQITRAHIDLPVVIPLFGPARRQGALKDARRLGFTEFATLVDPTAIVASSARLGAGVYVNAGVTLGGASRFGRFVFVNRGAVLGHHLDIGDFVSIGPGAILAGEVSLGRGAVIGAGATLLPKVKVGANSVISAGAVVTKDLPDHCLAAGNPARIVKRGIVGYGGVAVEEHTV